MHGKTTIKPIKKNLLTHKRGGDIKSRCFGPLSTAALPKLPKPFLRHLAIKQQAATQFYVSAFTISFVKAWNPTNPRTASVKYNTSVHTLVV